MVRAFLIKALIVFGTPAIISLSSHGNFKEIRIGEEKRQSLKSRGSLILQGTKVKTTTQVEGMLFAYKVILNSVKVEGSAQLKNSTAEEMGINGVLRFSKGKLGSLFVKGDGEINQAIISDSTLAGGAFSSHYTQFLGKVEIEGLAKFSHSCFKNKVKVEGEIVAKASVFEKEILINEGQAVFDDCKLNQISISNRGQGARHQRLILKGRTIVAGSVNFKDPGIIIIIGDQVSLKGQVKNAKIIYGTQKLLKSALKPNNLGE